MLRFTKEQQDFVLANRRQFNASQTAMATVHNSGLIGNALPLPKDVWGQWDREGIEVQRDVLAVFNDLAASVTTPMPIGKLVHHFQTISDSGSVNVSLDGRSKARTDQPVIEYHGTPLPILDSTFSYGWRQVEAARTEGFQLDSAARMNANYKVAEALELQTLNGDSGIVVGGDQLYGLRNHPSRNTRSTTNDLSTCTGPEWLADTNATLALLHADNFYSPATLYVNWSDWRYATSTDYSTSYAGKTIAQRIMEDAGVAAIVPSSRVAADEIIAVIKDKRVVQVLNGMPLVTRAQARLNPEDDYNFVTMAAAALEIKFDADGQCGIAHST